MSSVPLCFHEDSLDHHCLQLVSSSIHIAMIVRATQAMVLPEWSSWSWRCLRWNRHYMHQCGRLEGWNAAGTHSGGSLWLAFWHIYQTHRKDKLASYTHGRNQNFFLMRWLTIIPSFSFKASKLEIIAYVESCAFSIHSTDLDMARMFLIFHLCVCTLILFEMNCKVNQKYTLYLSMGDSWCWWPASVNAFKPWVFTVALYIFSFE